MKKETYILSEQHDDLAVDLEETIEYLVVPKRTVFIDPPKDKEAYLNGINSLLLNIPVISLYDNPMLLSKYPEGIVTENFILIPAEQFKKTKDNSIYEREYREGSKDKKEIIIH